MTEKLMVQEKEPLDIVARKIAEHAEQSEQSYGHIIEAALLVKKARRRVEAGEAGDVTWYEWARMNIKLPMPRLRELQQIADADDPGKEVERLRRLNQKRVEKHRKGKAKEQNAMETERKELSAWAKKAPIADVRRIVEIIRRTTRREQPRMSSPEGA